MIYVYVSCLTRLREGCATAIALAHTVGGARPVGRVPIFALCIYTPFQDTNPHNHASDLFQIEI